MPDESKDNIFSEKELNDFLSGNQVTSEKEVQEENNDIHEDEIVDNGTARELPSSQGAFGKIIVHDESSRDG